MITKICKTCEKVFKVRPYRVNTAIFCNRKCVIPRCVGWNRGTKGRTRSNKTSFKKGLIPWNKGKKGVQIAWNKGTKGVCKVNSGSFITNERRSPGTEFKKGGVPLNKGKKYKINNTENYGKVGDKHWNWQGGITPENMRIRQSLEYKLWRTAVFERDNYTCVECGDSTSGNLEADHIKPFCRYPELRLEVSNGRTFCKSCHRENGWSLFREDNPRARIKVVTKT